MDWKLEVVIVPVSDIDQARQFYETQVGFVVDHDTSVGESAQRSSPLACRFTAS